MQQSKSLNASLKATIIQEAKKELARRCFKNFVTYTKDDYEMMWFHLLLCEHLQAFAEGKIKKLMVFMPPQHGKSQLVSRHLPAYLLGKNPKTKIIGCSYASALSSAFNRDVQRIIDSEAYADVFPNTKLNDAKTGWLRNADIFEIVGYGGFYKSVGVGGSLTGTPADIGIIDDPVKDAVEADSITTRSRVWEWYESVFSSRLHNNSQVLLTMTRWHVDDLAGRILQSVDAPNWVVLKLPAIKEEATHHQSDKRQIGEALWPMRHSAEKIKMTTERTFQALYQQNPQPTKGGLVFPDVVIVPKMPDNLKKLAIGLDFGYTNHPTAAVLCGLDERTNSLYLDQLIYSNGMLNDAIAKELQPYNRLECYCDSAEPKSIDDLKRHGLIMAKPADKGKGSINAGIGILHQYKIHITQRSFGGIQEQARYTYKTDGYGNPTNDPIDDYNHFWDAVRYYALTKLHKPTKLYIA